MSSRNYESQILDAIQLLVDSAVSKAEFDKTIKATISRCVDATIGKYVIKYQNSSFYAYSTNTDTTYSAGTAVYVLIPGNDMSQEKSIIGTVDKLGTDYISIIEGENGYEVTGVNVIENLTTFNLCSYKTEDIVILYDRDNDVSLLNIDKLGLENYIKNSNSIICGATFKTNLPVEQRFRGDYGIVFNLDFIDNATGETVTRSYMVNTTQMTGQPYNFTTASRQYGIFEVDGSNFVSVKQIYIFSYDFPNVVIDEVEKPDDIFVSKIELSAANALSANDLSTSALTIITPQGIYFDDNNLEQDTKVLEAQIKIKGKNVDSQSQDIKYYWFRENGLVSSKSKAYNKYGGAGWECLNQCNLIQEATLETDALVEWVPASYRFLITKSQNVAYETKYKCVAIYNTETILTKTLVIYNYSSNYELEIKSDEGTTFYYDLGRPTLTCYVNGKEELEGNYTYAWSAIDNNNRFRNINETFKENNDYFEALTQYNELKAQIDNNEVLLTSAQAQLKLYQDALDQYDYIMRVEGNKIHKLKISEITKFTTYRCSVFKEGTLIGTTSIIISNNLKNESNYSVVINNGNQVFKYNEQGIAPDNKSLDNPMTILPLTFTVYDNEGREVSANAIGLENVRWIVPTDKTLINSSKIDNCIEEKEKENIYLGLTELNFGIARNYSINNDNNTIKLSINYKDNITLTAQTNFTFTKTGEVGTNGTDFVCKIVPNTDDEVIPKYPTVIYNERLNTYKLNYNTINADKWFKVQLWHDGEQVFEGTETGTSSENIEATVTWSILKNEYSRSEKDNSNLSIGSKNGVISVDNTKYECPANIIKCSIKYDGVEYYATMPVIFSRVKNEDYEILLLDNSGFNRVMYTADGQSPSYDNTSPFELIVNQFITGVKENISLYEPENYRVDYNWTVRGSVGNSEEDLIQNLIEKTMLNKKRNQASFRVVDTYNGFCVNNAIQCIITQKKEEIGSIHIPIHFFLNRYGNSAMNGWDGNSISFDNEGGVILAPQVGAGTKNDDNSFTGVFMGTVKETGMSASEHGLFGYSHGERTISLSAEDGSARFGRTGLGQIVIDPTSNEAVIRSGVYDEKTGVGMEINLTEPSIKFASGKFEVSSDGTVTAEAFATRQSVEELEQSISHFTVETTIDNIIVPSDGDNKPLESKTYVISSTGKYKGKDTTNYVVEVTKGNYVGIDVMIQENQIWFLVDSTRAIPNTTNEYEVRFSYTDLLAFKTYNINKNITIALAIQGKDGYQGSDGKSAYQVWLEAGNTGSEQDYLDSLKGADGQQGLPGEKGEDGQQGKSAYQIWLEAGNTGTEAEYLASLKGADGEPGKEGAQGPQGEPGKEGEQGVGVKEIKEQYYLSSSETEQKDGSWLDYQEDITSTRPYIWTRSEITWTDNKVTTTTPILASAINNANAAANDAANAANVANQNALDAKADATNANTVATQAKTDAATATSTANTAKNTADSALNKANSTASELSSLTTIVNQNYKTLQNQIDGAISTWFDSYVPTNSNEPAATWIKNNEQAKHIGDLFYITSGDTSGRCYRYAYINNEYKWVLVEDAEVTKAIEDAAKAQAAADGKATIFTGTATPQNPQEGDLWMKSANDGILTYVNGSWVTYNKYTDNTVANEAKALANSAVGSVNVQYYLSNSTDKLEGGSWEDIAPTWINGKYMWSRTKVISKDGKTIEYKPSETGTCIAGAKGATGATGGTGPAGKGVSSITELYYLSNSSTSAPTKPSATVTSTSTSAKVWTTKCPTWSTTNPYYWTCSEIKYSDNTYGWSAPILAAGLNSANSTANTANSTANSASSTANTAKSTAETAQSTAKAAQTAATNAQTTANTANTNATNAQNTANTANTTANAAKNAIDNLEIGGRNLLVGTATAEGDVATGGGELVSKLDLYNGLTGVRTNTAWSGRYINLKNVADRGGFKKGDQLVLSVYIKSDEEATVRVSCHRTYGTENINGSNKVYSNLKVSPQWQQVWFPFTADEGSLVRTDARIEVGTATGENYIYWAGWKLEKGTIATDWSPSTEDTIAEMNGTIVSVLVDYAVGNSTSIAPSTGWGPIIVGDVSNNQYIWMRTTTHKKVGDPEVAYSCFVYSQRELLNQEVEYILSNSSEAEPLPTATYKDNAGATKTWSKDKPKENVEKYSYLWSRIKTIYKPAGGSEKDAFPPIYTDYKLDTSWNKLFDLTGTLQDSLNGIKGAIQEGYVHIENGVIMIGDNETNPDNLIIMSHEGIAFFSNSKAGTTGWPTVDYIENNVTSTWTIDGTLNMQNINVLNLTASDIKNQNLILGNNNINGANVTGDLDIYDKGGHIMFETITDTNKNYIEGFKVHKYKVSTNAVSYNGYIYLSRENGLQEFDAGGKQIFGNNGTGTFIAKDFKAEKEVIATKNTSGVEFGIQIIPMTVSNTGDGKTHTGLAFLKF